MKKVVISHLTQPTASSRTTTPPRNRSVSPIRVVRHPRFHRPTLPTHRSLTPDFVCTSDPKNEDAPKEPLLLTARSQRPNLKEALTPLCLRRQQSTSIGEKKNIVLPEYESWRKQNLREAIKEKLQESPKRGQIGVLFEEEDPLKRTKELRKENIEYLIANALSSKLKPLSLIVITADEETYKHEVLVERQRQR